MAPTLESLGIDKLSLDEQCMLYHDLFAHLERETCNSQLSDDQRQDLRTRIQRADRGQTQFTAWEQVRNEVLTAAGLKS